MITANRAERSCPVCGTSAASARVFVEERLDPGRLNQFSFASRKEPEFMSNQMVQCPACDLVYVDAPPSQAELAQAYHEAAYDSPREAEDAADAYVGAIAPLLAQLPERDAVLEIGAGNGVFLDRMAQAGFRKLVGVEPSPAAIATAPAHRRSWLRQGIFREEDFEPRSFSLICCFMTMEHVGDPGTVARAACRLLRPGGALAVVVHDYRSPVNRLLGRRSPIIDIEHMQLFSPRSIRELFVRAEFRDVKAKAFTNRYSVNYWLRLLPLPTGLKQPIRNLLAKTRLGESRVALNVGNMIAWGRASPPDGS